MWPLPDAAVRWDSDERRGPVAHGRCLRYSGAVPELAMIAHMSLVVAWVANASAKTVEVDGFELIQSLYEHMVNRVSGPAKFDMGCDEIALTVLSTAGDKGRWSKMPASVGVSGCGQKRVYVWVPSTGQWVANTEGQQSPAQPEPAPTIEAVEEPATDEK